MLFFGTLHSDAYISFSPLLFTSLLFTAICKASSDSHFAFLHFGDIFKKIRDTKGTFHAKMGSIKDRNGMDLTEAEDVKKRCKNTQKNCTKKIFMTQIIMMV